MLAMTGGSTSPKTLAFVGLDGSPSRKGPVMSDLIRPIAESLRVSDFFMGLLTGDLSNAQATQRVRVDEGPSISWVVGHLLNGRCEILKLLDPKAENPFAEKFDRLVAASDGSDYPPLADLLSSWSDGANGRAGW